MPRIVRKQIRQEEEKDMSLELVQTKIKLDPETIAMLRGESELTGQHQNEIARQVLRSWAQRKAHEANVRDKHLKRMGFMGFGRGLEEDQE
jgi:hypothetical protein